MLAVCNGEYFGSGMHVAPMAKPDDGKHEVVSMDAPSKIAFATFSRQIYDGSHLENPEVSHFACERIEIDLAPESESSRDTFRLDVDGEPLGELAPPHRGPAEARSPYAAERHMRDSLLRARASSATTVTSSVGSIGFGTCNM